MCHEFDAVDAYGVEVTRLSERSYGSREVVEVICRQKAVKVLFSVFIVRAVK
jgi:hypothetical protein